MKKEKILSGLILLMVLIYAIQALQFIFADSTELASLIPLSYSQKLDRLDGKYYHNYFYRYYEWLNSIIPPTCSFSMLLDRSNETSFLRYGHKFNYYLYPRYVLPGEEKLFGYEKGKTTFIKGLKDVKNVEYSDLVFILDVGKTDLSRLGNLKFTILNGKTYYLVAEFDNKGLLAERDFIQNEVLKKTNWYGLKLEFRCLYGVGMEKAVF